MKGRPFQLDREKGKLLGVCAGLARMTGWNANLIRVGLIGVTLAGAFPWTLIAYGVAAWAAKPRGGGFRGGEPARTPRLSTARLTGSMRDLDRRLAEVETYVTDANGSLAREIEALR